MELEGLCSYGFAIRYKNRRPAPAGDKNQFQKESGFTSLQPAFYKGRRFSFGTNFRPASMVVSTHLDLEKPR